MGPCSSVMKSEGSARLPRSAGFSRMNSVPTACAAERSEMVRRVILFAVSRPRLSPGTVCPGREYGFGFAVSGGRRLVSLASE